MSNWAALNYNQCPTCGADLDPQKKIWPGSTKEKIYLTCFDCEFVIAKDKAERILAQMKSDRRF